ncbi:MAG: hypothetical protein Q8O25_08260 [Sulfurisoma sp.]|nr:hypothetical protein [Sulfurisoma sp.]
MYSHPAMIQQQIEAMKPAPVARDCRVTVTVSDPRTDDGMESPPIDDCGNQTKAEATRLGKEWAARGYWASVYDQASGECVDEFAPED